MVVNPHRHNRQARPHLAVLLQVRLRRARPHLVVLLPVPVHRHPVRHRAHPPAVLRCPALRARLRFHLQVNQLAQHRHKALQVHRFRPVAHHPNPRVPILHQTELRGQ